MQIARDWTFEGSVNNTTWDILDTRTGQTSWGVDEIRSYDCATIPTTKYRYFRLNVSANNGSANHVALAELVIYEAGNIGAETEDIEGLPIPNAQSEIPIGCHAGEGFPVVAEFSGTPLTGESPRPVQFTDLSLGEPDTWLWDFGDGTPTSAAQNPRHIYRTAGTFTVSLTVTGPAGTDTMTKTDYITITEKPVHVPDMCDKAVNMLIHELRYQYGEG